MTALSRRCLFLVLALVLSVAFGCGDSVKGVPPPDQSNVDPAKVMKANKAKGTKK